MDDTAKAENTEAPDFDWKTFLKITSIVVGSMILAIYAIIAISGIIIGAVYFVCISGIAALLGIYYVIFSKYYENTLLRQMKYSIRIGGLGLSISVLFHFLSLEEMKFSIGDEDILFIVLLTIAIGMITYVIGGIVGLIMNRIFK